MKTISFENNKGHIMRLDENSTIEDLIKIGVTAVRIEKPDAPLEEGWWRAEQSEAAK